MVDAPQAQEIATPEKSWFLQGLEEIGAFSKRLLRHFFQVLVVAQAFNLILATVVFYGASSGPAWQSPVAAAISFLATGAAAFWVSVQIGIVLSLAETVRVKGLAKRVLNGLFSELLGITEQKPEGDAELIKGLHGLPAEQLRARLHDAGARLLEHSVALALPGFLRWLVRKAQAVLVWATVWAVIKFATPKADADKKIDLLELRTNLAAVVDDLVTEKITRGAIRFGLLLAVAASALGWAIVNGLARLTN
jgi:hypothetical protein